MPPQVTETWASAYLQVLTVLLVFALGIPALVFQISIPEEIRHIMHRRKSFIWCYILMVILVMACLFFIWFFHPCTTNTLSLYNEYIASGVVTLILISVGIFWLFEFGSCKRKNLVLIIQKKLKKKFNKQKKLDKEYLDDLVYLGEHGNAGEDKEMVLKALNRLAANVQGAKGYQGVELEELIRGTERVVDNREKPGNDSNFSLAGNILKRIRQRANERTNISYLDADLALKGLGRLGVMAIERRSEAVAQGFLEAVTGNSQQVFEMGKAAFRAQYFLLALAALSRLETLAEKPGPNDVNISALLGLVAYFRAAGSSSARQRAELTLSQAPEVFVPSLPKCLQNAYDYYYSLADYETADKLLALMNATGHTGIAPLLAGLIPKTSGKVGGKRYRDPRAGDRVNKSS